MSSEVKTPPKFAKHPTVDEMVNMAIYNLGSRSGSSVHAIQTYMASSYPDVNMELTYWKNRVKNYIKSAIDDGAIVQAKGVGLAGSFRLSANLKLATRKKVEGKTPKQDKENAVEKKAAEVPKVKATKPKPMAVAAPPTVKPKSVAAKKPVKPAAAALKKPTASASVVTKPKKTTKK